MRTACPWWLVRSGHSMRLPNQRRDLHQLAGRLYARLFTYQSSKPRQQLAHSVQLPPHQLQQQSLAQSNLPQVFAQTARSPRLKPSLRSRAPVTGPGVVSYQPTVRLTFEDQLQLARVKGSGSIPASEVHSTTLQTRSCTDHPTRVSVSQPELLPSHRFSSTSPYAVPTMPSSGKFLFLFNSLKGIFHNHYNSKTHIRSLYYRFSLSISNT